MAPTPRPDADTAEADNARRIVAILTILPRIEACLQALGVHEQDVADLTQNTLVAALRHLHQFRPERGELASWVLEIARNEARKARAKARREVLSDEVDLALAAPEHESPFEVLRQREVRELLEAMLARLPPSQRAVIEGHHLHDRTLNEIAKELGAPRGTVGKWKRVAEGALEEDAERRKAKARHRGQEALPMLLPFLPQRTGPRRPLGLVMAAVGGAVVATILLVGPPQVLSTASPAAVAAPAPPLPAALPPLVAPAVATPSAPAAAPAIAAPIVASAPARSGPANVDDEVALLRQAMEAATAGRAHEARRLIQEHERRYPRSRHAPDRANMLRLIGERPTR